MTLTSPLPAARRPLARSLLAVFYNITILCKHGLSNEIRAVTPTAVAEGGP